MPLADRIPVSTDNFSTDFKQAVPPGCGRTARDPTRHPLGSFTPREQSELLGRPVPDAFDEQRQAMASAPTDDPVNRLVYLYASTYLQDDILFKVDRASMACSLGPCPVPRRRARRVPGRLPTRLKMRRLDTKHILKRAMADRLPAGIADRPRRGSAFQSPNGSRESCAHRCRKSCTRPDQPSGHLRRDDRNASRLEHLSGRRDHRKQLWTLFVFQLWHRRWVENDAPGTGARLTVQRLRSRRHRHEAPSRRTALVPAVGRCATTRNRGRGGGRRVRRARVRRVRSSPADCRIDSAPRSPDLVEQQRKTASAFGWQCAALLEQHPEFESQFLDWIQPLGPQSFRGKRVLDAGCGTGRHARYAATYGAAEVVALDLSGAVDALARTCRGSTTSTSSRAIFSGRRSATADGGGFDLVYSIGVLHHLPDPYAGPELRLPARWHDRRLGLRLREQRIRAERRRADASSLHESPTLDAAALAWPLAAGFTVLPRASTAR